MTDSSKKPGFIEFQTTNDKPKIDDLWFMVGSRCNLSCTHCYVHSSPTNNTLEQFEVSEVKDFLEQAKEFDVKNIYFTGGEPFINKDIIHMLKESLKYGNVTVLTNATYPIIRHIPKLVELKNSHQNELSFRISIDHYEREKHDEVRGKGNFDLTIKNTIELANQGFTPIITASAVVYEDNPLPPDKIEQKFKNLFKEQGVDVEVKLLPFTLEMGANLSRIKAPSKHVFISEDCMKRASVDVKNFQCFNGRTIQKINGKILVYPCPIIYNDKAFELAENLKDSFKKVYLTHKACFDFCYKSGGKCTN